ncbi:DNA-processing protein DprA [Comamonas humi]
MAPEELHGWLRLLTTPGVGSGTARRLLARFGLPASVFAQSAASLEACVSPALAQALLREPEGLAPLYEATARWLTEAPPPGTRRHIVTLGDPDYPALLLETADPPVLLYLLGAERWFDGDGASQRLRGWPGQALALVGSRNPTPQGKQNAQAFGRELGGRGFCIVSGLALGVDAAAHEGALAHEGAEDAPCTIAVVGTGLDRVYPRGNHALAQRIAAQGLVVSEYPLGTHPLAGNFPKRNRIISGLARGTVVIEAATESGSLVTARLASEQGREVFALPGSIHSPQSRGCHALIRQGAKLVERVDDILEELALPAARPAPAPPSPFPAEPGDGLLTQMGHEPVDLDALVARTGLDAARLQAQLLELELEGLVARMPGGLFQRVGQA